jgi:high affinity Mn2+ porin
MRAATREARPGWARTGLGASLCASLCALLLGAGPAVADILPDWLAVHGQSTFVLQGAPVFSAPYDGANSLRGGQRKETFDATLYVGLQPWRHGELWVDPEVDQGFGLSDTHGVAGFPTAEAYKVGQKAPYVRMQRLFFRQTVDLGGEDEAVAADQNVFAGHRTGDRLVVTVGKFSVGDLFDTNRYAHDPRNDVFNWALVDTGSFDYAAEAWGYSTGAALELSHGPWTLRAGAFNLTRIPNGETLEGRFQQYQLDGEIEHRHSIAGNDGAVRLTVFRNRGRFGRFDDALRLAAETGTAPDTADVRSRRSRTGVDLNVEQAVGGEVGVFARAGLADGQVEPYDFTDIDRTASAGVQIAGGRWDRPADKVGVAAVVNGISRADERYLAAGGLGLLVGDGRLPHPGAEAIGELYYRWAPVAPLSVTLDYQLIGDPGYNRDRGPANVIGVRLHGQF